MCAEQDSETSALLCSVQGIFHILLARSPALRGRSVSILEDCGRERKMGEVMLLLLTVMVMMMVLLLLLIMVVVMTVVMKECWQ